MIEIAYGQPTDEEVAAIVAALAQTRHAEPVEAITQPSAWALAARYPDMDIEDLRAVAGRVF